MSMTAQLTADERREPRTRAALALLLTTPAPTLGVLAAMYSDAMQAVVFDSISWGQLTYGLAKAWLLAMPLIWLLFVQRRPLSLSLPRNGGLWVGAGLGVVIAMIIFMTYFIAGDALLNADKLRAAVESNGIGTPAKYLALVIYLTLINSVLEEYVWRWFVVENCRALMGRWLAIGASAALFTLHHVFALKAQLDWPITIIGSLGVFIGGVAWSWCYVRYRSVWPGWVSHIIVDAAIFIIGWRVIFG